MKRSALAALLLCLCAGALCAGLSLGRPGAVKKRVSKLDARAAAFRAAGAAQAALNQPPVVSAVTAAYPTVAAGGLTSISVSALDPDGDTLSYVWSSTAGAIGGTGASINWLAPSTAGVYAVACAVSDGKNPVSRSVSITAVPPGTLHWKFTASANISLSPAVGPDGTVYAADDTGRLYAINPADGSQKWAFKSENSDVINFPPVVGGDGTVYVVAAGTKTYAVNPAGGKKWGPSPVVPANNISNRPVLNPDGGVYILDGTAHALYVLDQATGLGQSTFTALAGIAQPPVTGPGGTLYVTDMLDNLYSVAPGQSLSNASIISVPAISYPPAIGRDGSVYWEDNLYDLNASKPDGSAKWSPYSTAQTIAAPPVIGADGAVYVFTATPDVLTVSSVTGSGQSFTSLMGVAYAPVIGPDGSVYLVDSPGDLYAESPGGAFKWGPAGVQAPATAINSAPAVSAGGAVYFPSDDNKIYAVYGASALP